MFTTLSNPFFMKNFIHYALPALLIFLSACKAHYTDNKSIIHAENILFTDPDSAYIILSEIPNPEKLSKADYAAWCLHYTHACYKCYKDIKSDSLINIAIRYYDGSDLYKYSGTAYYLSGCISELMQNNEDAMLAYEEAIRRLEQTDEQNTLGLAYINKGYIYRQNEIYQEAFTNFSESLRHFTKTGNKRYICSAYQEISNMMLLLNYPIDSVMLYSNKALDLSREIKNTTLSYQIMARQGIWLSEEADKKRAISYLLTGYNHLPEYKDKLASYLAYTYSKMGMNDSALYFLNVESSESLSDDDLIIKELAKATTYKANAQYENAYLAMSAAYFKQDVVFRNKLEKNLYRIDKQYDLTEKEKENAMLKIANRNKIIIIGVLVIGVLVILLVYMLAMMRQKRRQVIYQIKQEQLRFELKQQQLEIEKKKDLLLSKLRQKIEITLQFNKFEHDATKTSANEAFRNILISQVILDETEWEYYINETDSLFSNKLSALMSRYQELTSSDMIVISLICLGIDVSDSCNLLNTSKNTMYIRRKRIKKRLEIAPEEDLVAWLCKYTGSAV